MTKTRDLANLGGGFIQSGTGADQRTVLSKLKEVVSVLDFIPEAQHAAIKDGTTTYDATSSIQEAINYAQTTGFKTVFVPSGTYRHSGLTISASNISFIGESRETTKLVCTNATANSILVKHPTAGTKLEGIQVSHLWLAQDSSSPKTSGASLRVEGAQQSSFNDLYITEFYDGIDTWGLVWSQITDVWFRRGTRSTSTPSNIALTVRRGSTLGLTTGTNVKVTRVDGAGPAYWVDTAFYIDYADWTVFRDCHFNNANTTVNINVQDTLGNAWFQGCYFDACNNQQVRLQGSNTELVKDLRFDNCYFRLTGDSSGRNFYSTFGGTIDGLVFSNSRFNDSNSYGIYVDSAATLTNLQILGCRFDGNLNGSTLQQVIEVKSLKTTITGCTFIDTGGNTTLRVTGDGTASSSVTIDSCNFLNATPNSGDHISIVDIPTDNRNIGTNLGHKNEVYGTITGVAVDASSEITVAHGLVDTPDYVDAKVWGSSGRIVHPSAVGATNIKFKVFEADGTPLAAGVQPPIRWWAKVTS